MPRKVARNEDSSELQETLQLDLEGFTPESYDKEGVSILLKHLFPEGCIVSAPELASYIVSHNSVGTVVKPPADDEDSEEDQDIIFSVTSVVNLSVEEAEKHSIVKRLREFIIGGVSKSASTSNSKDICNLLENQESSVFLLINERFDNLPLSICADAVASLPEELKKSNLSPTHLLLLSWAYRSRDSAKAKEELDYAYSELKHIRPLSLYHLELDSKSLASDTEKVWDTHEEITGYNTLLLTVLKMDKFAEVLDSLKKHL